MAKSELTIQDKFETIAKWLNSCKTDKQIRVCVEASERLLRDCGAEKEHLIISDAADIKLYTPSHKLIV